MSTPTATHVQAGPMWNGLPTTARQGSAVVADDPEFLRYWAREAGLIGTRIAVVEVDLDGVAEGGGQLWLDDRHGEGTAKVYRLGGSSRAGHRQLDIAPGSFVVAPE